MGMTKRRPSRGSRPESAREPSARDLSEKDTTELYLDLLGLDEAGRRRLKDQIADCYRQLDLKRT